MIYRSGLRWADILEQLRTRFPTGPAAVFYEFLSTTARGIISERRAPPGATIKLRETVEAEPEVRVKFGYDLCQWLAVPVVHQIITHKRDTIDHVARPGAIIVQPAANCPQGIQPEGRHSLRVQDRTYQEGNGRLSGLSWFCQPATRHEENSPA